jgi:cysteine desulfurase / selenocysteine lyase
MAVTARAILPVPARRFPGLQSGLLSRRRVYLDNACLTPAPAEVAEAVKEYYTQPPACPLRNNSGRSGDVEERIRDARDSVRRFLNAKFSDEIIFTPNTTFGINLLAGAFLRQPGKVLISDLEHNSNRLPWLAHERLELPWPPGEPFPLDTYRRALHDGVKLVSLTAMSNVTGEAPPVREIVREATALGIPVHLDAAQAFASGELDITELRPDFVSFSLHKAYGPTGLGGLYMRRDWRARLDPGYAGAGTVDDHSGETSHWTEGAPRFEFGLQNYAAIHAVPAAMALLAGIPAEDLRQHYTELNTALREQLRRIPGLRIVGPANPADAHHVCSFHLPGADALRLSALLDMVGNFQVRAGRLCAHHWFHQHEVPDVIRVSFGIHNSLEEVEAYGRVFDNILRHYD